jgi:serine/threonine-protein kinase SBK
MLTLIGQVNLVEEYDILQTVGEGWFAKVLLAEHRRTRAEVVLKAVSKDTTSRREFFREFHYSYYLSPHPAVSKTYDCAFESERYFFFAQRSLHQTCYICSFIDN